MRTELSEADIVLVREVIAHSELRSIDFYEVSARRVGNSPDGVDPGKLTIEAQQRFGEGNFGIRLNATAVVPAGEATAEVVGEYALLHGVQPSVRALQLFANEVAIMTILPHVREAVATITAKVFNVPLHLPLVERGEIALEVEALPASAA